MIIDSRGRGFAGIALANERQATIGAKRRHTRKDSDMTGVVIERFDSRKRKVWS